MTEREVQLAAGAAAVVLVLLVVWIRAWRMRRQLVRRIASVTSRLEAVPTADVVGRGRLEAAVSALERAAGAGASRVAEAEVAVERLSDALRFVGCGVVVTGEDGEPVFTNDLAVELLEAMDGGGADLLDRLGAAVAEGQEAAEEVEVVGPPERALVATAAPLVNPSRAIGAVVVLTDVTDLRRLEAVGREVVADLALRLGAPIAGLGLLAETLAGEHDPAVAARLSARLQGEAAVVRRIVDDFLDLARLEAQATPRRGPVPLHLVLAEATNAVRPQATARGVAIEVQEPPRRLSLRGDRAQLASAVRRLVENAVLHAPPDSIVTVAARTTASALEVTVADAGPGIPPAELERIFERFYRVGGGADPAGTPGAGLGLAIARTVARAHGGEVRVQSEVGRGSTFTLRLPVGPGPVAVSPPAAETA